MKFAVLVIILGLFSSVSSFAVSPVDKGKTLGIEDGTYFGSGTMDTYHLPTPYYESERILKNGEIIVHSRAYALKIKEEKWYMAGEAKAHLKILPGENGDFEMFSVTDQKIVGSGSCDEHRCSFKVTLPGQDISLIETWAKAHEGFVVFDGEQTAKGIYSTYSDRFIKQEK